MFATTCLFSSFQALIVLSFPWSAKDFISNAFSCKIYKTDLTDIEGHGKPAKVIKITYVVLCKYNVMTLWIFPVTRYVTF